MPDRTLELQVRQALHHKQYEKAAGLAQQWCESDPQDSAPLIFLAGARYSLDRHAGTSALLLRALQYPVRGQEYCLNLASLLLYYGHFSLARKLCLQMLELDKDVPVYRLMGEIHTALGEFEEAAGCYGKVLDMQPGDIAAQLALSLLQLEQRRYRSGFEGYEMRKQLADNSDSQFMFRHSTRNLQPGMAVAGKRVLVPMEQGVGDCVQWLRYIPLLREAGAEPVIYGVPRMQALAGLCDGVVQVTDSIAEGEFDYVCDIGSLPHFFSTTWETVPSGIPYLKPPVYRVRELRQRYQRHFPGLPIVGISWTGGKSGVHRFRRSVPLPAWAPVLGNGSLGFVSVQYNDRFRQQLRELPVGLKQQVYDDREVDPVNNLVDAAAQIAACDLIISVDNSCVHLAGAMGKNVWTLLPTVSDWRWTREGESSPWYPQMRLWRQTNPMGWDEVMASVAAALEHEELPGPGDNGGPADCG